jgi:hypothetical protein
VKFDDEIVFHDVDTYDKLFECAYAWEGHTEEEEVANSLRAGVVTMPEESNDSHLGVAVPDLVSHTISPYPRQDTSRSGGASSP